MDAHTQGRIEVNTQECTGCGICIGSCKEAALDIAPVVNRFGVYPVQLRKENCGGCATCYYLCPEPGAILIVN
jgi:ferredoxin